MDEKDILKDIKKVAHIRETSQLLFCARIEPSSVIQLREAIESYKNSEGNMTKIDVIIQSGGGTPSDAYRIVRLLRKNFKEVNIIIPFWAKSAATLIALGASSLIMNKFGELGAIDMQITKEREESTQKETKSALNDESAISRIETRSQNLVVNMYNRLVFIENLSMSKKHIMENIFNYVAKFYEPLLNKIDPYELGDAHRALKVNEEYAKKIFFLTKKDNIAPKNERLFELFIDFLLNRCPEHGFIIDLDFMQIFFNNVKDSSEITKEYDEAINSLSINFMKISAGAPLLLNIYIERYEKEKRTDK